MSEQIHDNPDETLKKIQELLAPGKKNLRSTLYRNIVNNALECQRGELDILDLKILDRAVAEYQHAACVFKPYRAIRKISIFGSARVTADNPYYQLAVEFGRLAVDKGFMVITGGADGIMKAGIEGAGPKNSFGVNIMLPTEQLPNTLLQDDPKLVTFKYFFIRKVFFVMEADAFALFPGGFGTMDEGFEVLTLLQTGKAPPAPVVLMELPGERYWEAWDQFVGQQLLERGLISPEDCSFYRIMHSPEEAIDWIKSYYSTYHSSRQVRDRLVVRLQKELTDDQIRLLNDEFADLVKSGRIYRTKALDGETDEPELISKPRIAFIYNKKSAGRLNEFINTVNRLGQTN